MSSHSEGLQSRSFVSHCTFNGTSYSLTRFGQLVLSSKSAVSMSPTMPHPRRCAPS